MGEGKQIVRFGLSLATIDKLCTVFARHTAVAHVVIYGSRAKGNYRPGSDIDLTIKTDMSEAISFAEFLQIEDEIDDLLLPYTVDLSQYVQLENIDLIAYIDRVGQILFQRATDKSGFATK